MTKPVTKYSDQNLPVRKFFIRPPESNEARLRPSVYFITYGLRYGPTGIFFRTVLTLDLSNDPPPPQYLCERFTGLDKKLSDSFFSIPTNEATFLQALKKLREGMKTMPKEGYVAVAINCTLGRHRSVTMADRLAMEVSRVDGFYAECLHLDIEKGGKVKVENSARLSPQDMSEDIPARKRTPLKYKAQAMSEVRVSEKRSRGAAATADAVLSSREPPVRKTIKWEMTELERRERHTQQRESIGRSADPWNKDEDQSRRLSL